MRVASAFDSVKPLSASMASTVSGRVSCLCPPHEVESTKEENTYDPLSILALVDRDPVCSLGGLYRVCSIEAPGRPGSPIVGPPAVSQEVRYGRKGAEDFRHPAGRRQGWHPARSSRLR